MGKGENAGIQHFLLITQWLLPQGIGRLSDGWLSDVEFHLRPDFSTSYYMYIVCYWLCFRIQYSIIVKCENNIVVGFLC